MHFTIGHFTIPIVKCTFFLLRKIRFKKERFTIGIVKLPIVKRSVPKSPNKIGHNPMDEFRFKVESSK